MLPGNMMKNHHKRWMTLKINNSQISYFIYLAKDFLLMVNILRYEFLQ